MPSQPNEKPQEDIRTALALLRMPSELEQLDLDVACERLEAALPKIEAMERAYWDLDARMQAAEDRSDYLGLVAPNDWCDFLEIALAAAYAVDLPPVLQRLADLEEPQNG